MCLRVRRLRERSRFSSLHPKHISECFTSSVLYDRKGKGLLVDGVTTAAAVARADEIMVALRVSKIVTHTLLSSSTGACMRRMTRYGLNLAACGVSALLAGSSRGARGHGVEQFYGASSSPDEQVGGWVMLPRQRYEYEVSSHRKGKREMQLLCGVRDACAQL